MEFKGSKSSTPVRRTKRRKPAKRQMTTNWIHKAPSDTFVLTSTWDSGLLSSGTTGVIATTRPASFVASATEYTPVSSLYTEIKLLRAVLVITAINPRSATNVEGKLVVGWNPAFSSSSFLTPSGFASVNNLAGWKVIPSAKVNPTECPAYVQTSVYNLISNTTPLPDTGDCGSFVLYSDVLTPSTNYFTTSMHCTFAFRGRI